MITNSWYILDKCTVNYFLSVFCDFNNISIILLCPKSAHYLCLNFCKKYRSWSKRLNSEIKLVHYLSHNWLIFYCIVLTLSLPHLLSKVKNKRLLLFVCLFYVSVCVFNFGSGLMMALDWQDPFAAGAILWLEPVGRMQLLCRFWVYRLFSVVCLLALAWAWLPWRSCLRAWYAGS